jgi:WASH complex subunit 7
MGVAYILKLLDQYQAFDSLHWIRSCRAHYARERQKVTTARSAEKQDEKLQQTVALTLNRMANYEREMDLLSYSLSSARIFFRADQTAAEEKVEKEQQAAV